MQLKRTILAAAVAVMGVVLISVPACSGSDGTGSNVGPQLDYGDAGTSGGTKDGGGGGNAGATFAVTEKVIIVDAQGGPAGARVDANLVNPWGLAITDAGTIWIANNGTGTSSVVDATGAELLPAVTIPTLPGSPKGSTAAPTGLVWNPDPNRFAGDSFIFVTEEGTIAGWQSGTEATLRVDNSSSDAIYKGVEIFNDRLFATNFRAGTVDVFDTNYLAVASFEDPNMPSGFAPFNVAEAGGKLYVTFAKQDENKEDDVKGAGNGFIDVFDPVTGEATRLVSNGPLNAPWGLTIAPSSFGTAGGMLLVGNFGDGTILVVDPDSGTVQGNLVDGSRAMLAIDGLWALEFSSIGGDTLYFTAGPNDEENGAFGTLVPVTQ